MQLRLQHDVAVGVVVRAPDRAGRRWRRPTPSPRRARRASRCCAPRRGSPRRGGIARPLWTGLSRQRPSTVIATRSSAASSGTSSRASARTSGRAASSSSSLSTSCAVPLLERQLAVDLGGDHPVHDVRARQHAPAGLESAEQLLDVDHVRLPLVAGEVDQVGALRLCEHHVEPHRDDPQVVRREAVRARERHHRVAVVARQVGDRAALLAHEHAALDAEPRDLLRARGAIGVVEDPLEADAEPRERLVLPLDRPVAHPSPQRDGVGIALARRRSAAAARGRRSDAGRVRRARPRRRPRPTGACSRA